jgi:hypothetical protein
LNYVSDGVVGLLFGNGQFTTTDYMDYANDGITSPPAINGNTLVASYADDDGGFLRTSAAAYYLSGPISTSPPATFAIAARVETMADLKVYKKPSSSSRPQCLEAVGNYGTISNGPSSSGGYTWWYVAFSGCSGWVVQNYLSLQQ